MSTQLSEQDIQFYKTHGYFFTQKVLSDHLLDAVVSAQEEFYRGIHEPWPFTKVPICGWKPGDPPQLRKNDYTSVMIPAIRNLILEPILGEMARALCGERVRLWQDQLSLKEPGDNKNETVMGWHTDRQYWSCCSSEEMITAWIPLEDMQEETGPIMFLDGSHKWENIEGMSFFRTDLTDLEKEISRRGYELKRVPAAIKKGQVSFHHCKTLHGSGPNTSARPRRALSVHMQPVSNSPVKNKFHIVKLMCTELGDTNFNHPLLFPELGNK